MQKIVSQFLFLFLAVIFFLTSPIFAAGPPIAGQYLTTGQTIIGVTGSAPLAKSLLGTTSQVTVTNSASAMTFSLPSTVQLDNLIVTGTLSPYTTGMLSIPDATITYGISAATFAFSGGGTVGGAMGVTGAFTGSSGGLSTTLAVQGASYFGSNANATVSTLTAAGALAVHTSVTAPAIAGTTSITGGSISGTTLTATGAVSLSTCTFTGGIIPLTNTQAFWEATAVTAGTIFRCSDCTVTPVCISTGGIHGLVSLASLGVDCD